MWEVNGNDLTMTEEDFGIQIPFTIDLPLTANDSIRMTFKRHRNDDPILEKEFTNILNQTINLEFTEEESKLLPPGNYVYRMDWYQAGVFMCNVIECAKLRVGDKA